VGLTICAVLLTAGCSAPVARESGPATPVSSTATPSRTPKLPPPPPQDGAVQGALSRVAVPAPPGFVSPRGGSGAARSGPFTLRSYVRDFLGGDRGALADLRLGRLQRGYHRFATTGSGAWMHVYLFESEDNYGATTLRNMLFGSGDAEPYEPRLLDDALGQVVRSRDDGGRYTTVKIAFVTGNVYVEVMVSGRARRPHSRLAERVAVAQKQRIRASLAPTA
jgi:hypothetical protein